MQIGLFLHPKAQVHPTCAAVDAPDFELTSCFRLGVQTRCGVSIGRAAMQMKPHAANEIQQVYHNERVLYSPPRKHCVLTII